MLGVIRQWVDISLYNQVAKVTNPYTLWKNLENMYETKNTQEKKILDALANLKLNERQSISECLNDFEGMISQLSVVGLSLDDETQECLVLSIFPNSWNTLVVSL